MKCPVCKKNISDTALKCPYCKTRTGLLCSHCNTINPVGNLVCQKCGQELLKICPHCHSVNFPIAAKCRKCGSPLGKKNVKQNQNNDKDKKNNKTIKLEFNPKYSSQNQAFEMLSDGLRSKDTKIFSITGEKGIGKSNLLKQVIKNPFEHGLIACENRVRKAPLTAGQQNIGSVRCFFCLKTGKR